MASEARGSDAAYLHAADAVTLEDQVALCLQNASRVNPRGSYRTWLRKLIEEPEVLDFLERAVTYWRLNPEDER